MNFNEPPFPGNLSPARPQWLNVSLWILLFTGMGLGVFSLWKGYFIFTDGTVYATLGKNLAEGNGLRYCGETHLFYPPGYPLATALFDLLFHDAEFSAHFVSLLAYLGIITLTARLAWALRPSPVFVFTATSIAIFHPVLLVYSRSVMSEALFVCVVLASALCTWKLATQSRSPWWLWGLWGLLGGYAYLIRADGIVYWPLQALFIAGYRRCLSDGWKGLLSMFLFVGILYPYASLIHRETGKWQLSTKTAVLLEFARMKMADNTVRGETRQTSQLSEDGKSFLIDQAQDTLSGLILENPKEVFARVLWNGRQLLRHTGIVFGWPLLILAGSLVYFLRWRFFSAQSIFLALHLTPIAVFLFFYIDERFLLTFIPFFCLAYARILDEIVLYLQPYSWKKILAYGLPTILLVGAGTAPVLAPRVYRAIQRIVPSDLPLEHKQMGLWMQANLSITSVTRISHRNPWVSFYAGGCHVRTPDFGLNIPEKERLERLLKWCREQNVRYLIADERMTLPTMPGLVFLLDETRPFPGLRLKKTIQGEYPKIVLYEVVQ